jgi:hypothetical protein
LSHTSGNILLHFIFSTRGRRSLIKRDFQADLFAYLGGIVREMNGTALIVNGTTDHVHMLLRVRPGSLLGRGCACRKGQLVSVGAGEVEPGVCVADRIRRVQRERIEGGSGDEIHRGTGGTSQEAFLSAGVSSVPEEEPRGV